MIRPYLLDKNKEELLVFIDDFIDELEINYGIDADIQETIIERINKDK